MKQFASPVAISRKWMLLAFAGSLVFFFLTIKRTSTLSNYDSGVYGLAALKFVHGILPYKDFVFVQPPGILLLLSPLALTSYFCSSATTFTLFKFLTCVANAATASMIFGLLEVRSRLLAIIATTAFASSPIFLFIDSSVKLEPYLLFLVMWSIFRLSLFDGVQIPRRELIKIGIFLGFAVSIKYWAVVPLLAISISLFPRIGRRAWSVILASGLTSLMICLPFIMWGGKNFFIDTIFAQILRTSHTGWQTSIWIRIYYLLGWSFPPAIANQRFVLFMAIELLALLTVGLWGLRRLSTSQIAILVVTIMTVFFLLLLPEWFPYYATLSWPFFILAASYGLLGVKALTIGRLAERALSPTKKKTFMGVALCVTAVCLALVFSVWACQLGQTQGAFSSKEVDLAKTIPQGSCTIFDIPYFGIISNRYLMPASCPNIVDPSGIQLVASAENLSQSAITDYWEASMSKADYVVLYEIDSPFIPRNPPLLRYFHSHFEQASKSGEPVIFKRIS